MFYFLGFFFGLFMFAVGVHSGSTLWWALGGYLAFGSFYQYRKTKNNKKNEMISEECVAKLINLYQVEGVEPIYSELRRKQNEFFFAESDSVFYRFKSNGSHSAHALYKKMKLPGGVTYTIGHAQAKAGKSWKKDGEGMVSISNQALTITTSSKSKRFTWGGVAKLEVFLNGFYLTPVNGSVIRFEFPLGSKSSYAVLALLAMESQQEGAIAGVNNTVTD